MYYGMMGVFTVVCGIYSESEVEIWSGAFSDSDHLQTDLSMAGGEAD